MINSFRGQYDFLSNFYPASIMYDGFEYPTSEHLYQSAKTKNMDERNKIRLAETPGQAKRLGAKCHLRENWDERKELVMTFIVRWKFQNPELAQKLLDTGDETLVEGNYWHDNFWGNCFCQKCKNIPGQNRLGKILMKIRKELRNDRR
jgi:ribA/ribD-fused uncharacterized protein